MDYIYALILFPLTTWETVNGKSGHDFIKSILMVWNMLTPKLKNV